MPVLIALVVGLLAGFWLACQDVAVPFMGPTPGQRAEVLVSAMADRMDALEERQRMCCDEKDEEQGS